MLIRNVQHEYIKIYSICHIWHGDLCLSAPLLLLCPVLVGMTHCFVLLGDSVLAARLLHSSPLPHRSRL